MVSSFYQCYCLNLVVVAIQVVMTRQKSIEDYKEPKIVLNFVLLLPMWKQRISKTSITEQITGACKCLNVNFTTIFTKRVCNPSFSLSILLEDEMTRVEHVMLLRATQLRQLSH